MARLPRKSPIDKSTKEPFSHNEGGAKLTGGIPISPDGRRAREVLSVPEMRIGADQRSGYRRD